MIEIVKKVPADRLQQWLEQYVRTHLKPDVSNYAKGRLRVWLRHEPTLTSPTRILPGLPLPPRHWERLAEILGWPFDYCLVTYSGDKEAIGIAPHRDASYANYEAWTLNVSGECRFDYWMGRPAYDSSTNGRGFKVDNKTGLVSENGKIVTATHSHILTPGDIIRFNCKDPHAATPGVRRWNMNFWRAKQ